MPTRVASAHFAWHGAYWRFDLSTGQSERIPVTDTSRVRMSGNQLMVSPRTPFMSGRQYEVTVDDGAVRNAGVRGSLERENTDLITECNNLRDDNQKITKKV